MSSSARRHGRHRGRGHGVAGRSELGRQLAGQVEELRQALAARARAVGSDEPEADAHNRAILATLEIQQLLSGDRADDVLEAPLDGDILRFASLVAALTAAREGYDIEPGEPGIDAQASDIADGIQAVVEELLWFEALPFGERVRLVAENAGVTTLASAAMCVFGLGWDPLSDNAEIAALGTLAAALLTVRASMDVADAVGSEAADRLFTRIDAAAVALEALDIEERQMLLWTHGPVAWRVRGALAAGVAIADWRTVVRSGGSVPVAFAIGAFGRDWLAGADLADDFASLADDLATTTDGVTATELRQQAAGDPAATAYLAGSSWRLASDGTPWRLPWDAAPGARST